MVQMRHRCPDARVVGTSLIEHYRLLFKGSRTGAYLTIEPQEGASVPVAVWSVSETDEQALDTYEGFPGFYDKKEMLVSIKGIRTGQVRQRTAFVYIMHEERPFGIPTHRYFEVCNAGYTHFGFDKSLLTRALADSSDENTAEAFIREGVPRWQEK